MFYTTTTKAINFQVSKNEKNIHNVYTGSCEMKAIEITIRFLALINVKEKLPIPVKY